MLRRLLAIGWAAACAPPPASTAAPAWLSEHQLFVYGAPAADYLHTLDGTASIWGVFFRGVNDAEAAYVEAIQGESFHVLSNFSTMQGYEDLTPEPGIEERSACRTLAGERARFFWAAEDPQPWITCHNNPEWADSLHRRIAEHARAGVHGVHIDEVEGIAGFLFVAGFCRYCMSGFREHLRASYPDPDERLARFGIVDLDAFDYGAVLRGAGRTLTTDPNRERVREFVRFQMLGRRGQIESLARTAREAGGTDLAVSANTTFLSPPKQIFVPALDLCVYENLMAAPPEGRYLAMHVWARGIDPAKRFVIFPVSVNLGGLTEDDWPVIAFWLLEALAGGQGFLVPFDAYTGFGPRYTVPAEPLAPVGRFVRAYDERFPVREPLADVAVIYDLATGLDEYLDGGFAFPIVAGRTDASIRGIGRALAEGHVPYMVVVSGDGSFVRAFPSADDLRAFSAVVLPTAPSLREETMAVLDAYRAEGGQVVDVGDLGARYEETGEEGASAEILALVRSVLPEPRVMTDAGDRVAIVPWRAGDALLVHLLNYDYDRAARSFAPARVLDVEVRLPPGMDASGKTLTIEGPWDPATPLPFAIEEGAIRFVVPSLSGYLLAVLR